MVTTKRPAQTNPSKAFSEGDAENIAKAMCNSYKGCDRQDLMPVILNALNEFNRGRHWYEVTATWEPIETHPFYVFRYDGVTVVIERGCYPWADDPEQVYLREITSYTPEQRG